MILFFYWQLRNIDSELIFNCCHFRSKSFKIQIRFLNISSLDQSKSLSFLNQVFNFQISFEIKFQFSSKQFKIWQFLLSFFFYSQFLMNSNRVHQRPKKTKNLHCSCKNRIFANMFLHLGDFAIVLYMRIKQEKKRDHDLRNNYKLIIIVICIMYYFNLFFLFFSWRGWVQQQQANKYKYHSLVNFFCSLMHFTCSTSLSRYSLFFVLFCAKYQSFLIEIIIIIIIANNQYYYINTIWGLHTHGFFSFVRSFVVSSASSSSYSFSKRVYIFMLFIICFRYASEISISWNLLKRI